jgi:hypothetical protein
MAHSQVVSVTTSAQTITLEGSARWLEFRPLGSPAASTVTVSTFKDSAGTPIAAVSEDDDMETFAVNPAQVVRMSTQGAPSFSIIGSAASKVFVQGVDL